MFSPEHASSERARALFLFCMIRLNKFPTVSIVAGLPGSGKTTHAAAVVRTCFKKHIKVFSNVPIAGAYKFDWVADFGNYDLSNSFIILDECGIELDNRQFKTNFPKEKVVFLKLLRHYHCKLIVYSQTWGDMDLKVRNMAGVVYICKKSLIPGCTVLTPVIRSIDVDENTHQLIDSYQLGGFWRRLFKSSRFCRRFYYKYFDSYDAPLLPAQPKSQLWGSQPVSRVARLVRICQSTLRLRMPFRKAAIDKSVQSCTIDPQASSDALSGLAPTNIDSGASSHFYFGDSR